MFYQMPSLSLAPPLGYFSWVLLKAWCAWASFLCFNSKMFWFYRHNIKSTGGSVASSEGWKIVQRLCKAWLSGHWISQWIWGLVAGDKSYSLGALKEQLHSYWNAACVRFCIWNQDYLAPGGLPDSLDGESKQTRLLWPRKIHFTQSVFQRQHDINRELY